VDDVERRRGNGKCFVVREFVIANLCAIFVGACGAPTLTFADEVPASPASDASVNDSPTSVPVDSPASADGTGLSCTKDADCARGNCAGTCQPCPRDMANVPTTTGAASYCVDAREVTVAGYNAFLLSSPWVSLLPTSCATKTSFGPSTALDLAHPTYPVNYVDWCDAYAYCAGLNRHLCGRIGGGSAIGTSDFADATKSEWHNACSKGGTQAYPYGTSYVGQRCIDNLSGPRAVGSALGCVGGYPGLNDMSGNVQEWEDNCTTGQGLLDDCKTRGGSYDDGSSTLTCATKSSSRKRSAADASTGFRCCL